MVVVVRSGGGGGDGSGAEPGIVDRCRSGGGWC